MKRKIIHPIYIFLICISLGVFSLYGCNSKTNEKALSKVEESNTNGKLEELKPVKISKGSLNIMVDPRIELLSAVQLNSGYHRLTKLDFKYKDNMKNYFNNYKNHEAVKKFETMSNGIFTYDAPPAAMLYLSNPLNLEKQVPFTSYLKGRAGGGESLNSFVSKLQSFAVDSNFKEFYTNNKEFYKNLTKSVEEILSDYDLAKDLNDYYGMKKNSYNLILAPLFHPGGYGPQVKRVDGTYDVYGILGPQEIKNNVPVFSEETIRYLAWHEFSHSFVNPTTEKFKNEIDKYSSLYTPISNIMSKQAYGNWESCVDEHIVRAVTTRLSYIHLGTEEGEKALKYEKSCGFYYIEPLCEKLQYYENNRDKYLSFEEFYPELIKVFKELSEKDLDEDFYTIKFEGPINGAFQNLKKVIFILPTNEIDKKVEKNVQAYIKKHSDFISKKFKVTPEIINDTEALEKDLSDYTIMAYGTIKGNKWLSKRKSTFPFTINEDKIMADTEYTGTNLRFITGLPNPQNPNKALLIYTAQQAKEIVGINHIFNGPTDYLIVDGEKEIKAGNYIKNNEKWTFD